MFRTIIEAVTGVVMFILGLLFLIYIPNSPTNVATDLIFFGAGILIIRRAYDNRKKASLQPQPQPKNKKKQKQNPSKNN